MSVILDEIGDSGKLHVGQDGMTATRMAKVAWENWPAAVVELMGIPVWFGGFMYIVGRQNYPGIPYLQVDSIEVEGMGRRRKSNWFNGPSYDFGKLTIQYKVPEGEDDKDENGQPSAFLIESLDFAVEVAIVPMLVVDEADRVKIEADAQAIFAAAPSSNPDGSPAPIPEINKEPKKKTVKHHIRLPSITYTTVLPRLPNLPVAEIRAAVGKLNSKSIFGGPPGTVLFDGPQAERESVFFTQRLWRATYKHIYQPHGWNNVLHPDTLKWVPAKAVGSDNNPYEYYDLRKLYPAPYKVSN